MYIVVLDLFIFEVLMDVFCGETWYLKFSITVPLIEVCSSNWFRCKGN